MCERERERERRGRGDGEEREKALLTRWTDNVNALLLQHMSSKIGGDYIGWGKGGGTRISMMGYMLGCWLV